MPEGFPPRYRHSLTATSLAPGITVATAFGGRRGYFGDRIAETTLLQFGEYYDCPPILPRQNIAHCSEASIYSSIVCFRSSPNPERQSGQWGLTDVTLSSQLGREDRVREKRRKIEAARQQPTTAQPQATSPRAARERERVLEQRAQEAERREQEAQWRLRDAEQRAQALQQRLLEAEAATQNALEATDSANQRVREVTQSLQHSERRVQESERMVAELEARCRVADERVQRLERVNTDLHQEINTTAENLRRRLTELEAANQQMERENAELQRGQQATDRTIQTLRRRAEAAELRAQVQETQWVVERGEIQLTEEEKGRGGWAVVRVANFRGIRVAAKCLHEQISEYYSDLFTREMNMAARLRHPNLVQFIGATRTGKMIILTELMPTSLRAVLEQRANERLKLEQNEINSISLDVARALSYLHLTQPEPLIHRDISSANVLLEPGPNNSWKAKVSDYGSVNLQRQLRTIGPGSPVYAAPEANTTDQQSPKMDIFSFGVLLIEMCTARFPEVAARQALLDSIENHNFVELIGRCMSREIGSRPSASEIITQLTQLRQL